VIIYAYIKKHPGHSNGQGSKIKGFMYIAVLPKNYNQIITIKDGFVNDV